MSDLHHRLITFLDDNHINYQLVQHPPTLTSEDAAGVRGTLPSQGAKAMLFIADKKPILLVLSGDKKIDSSLFKKTYHFKDLKLAPYEQVESITGALPGAVPPFGNLFSVPVYVDQGLLVNESIAFNAGLRTASVIMKTVDYLNLVKPLIGNYAQISHS